jgi:hypothetical protein
MGELTTWPEKWSLHEACDVVAYERARAEAAIERLKCAVTALRAAHSEIKEHCGCLGDGAYDIEQALASIGDIPGDK